MRRDYFNHPMNDTTARVVVRGLRKNNSHLRGWATICVVLFLVQIFSPIASSAGLKLRTDDFGVLDLMHEVLGEGSEIEGAEAAKIEADSIVNYVNNKVRESTSIDPLGISEDALENMQMMDTTPPLAIHPMPYQLLTTLNDIPDDLPEDLWDTLNPIGLNQYVVFTNYTLKTGESIRAYDSASFTGDIFSGAPFENLVDINGDSNDDLRVSLSITFGDNFGFNDNDQNQIPDQIWIKPSISYHIESIDSSASVWDDFDRLEVSLLKGFAYTMDDDSITTGENYVWVIDSRFTQTPNDFTMGVGLEQVIFDIGNLSESVISALLGPLVSIITLLDFVGGLENLFQDATLTVALIAAPYEISIDNSGQYFCNEEYNPSQRNLTSPEQDCGLSVGLGYVHYPESGHTLDLYEVAYFDATFHPNGKPTSNCGFDNSRWCLPKEAELTIRNDNIGEDSLDTIEFWADRRSDLFIHYHEDRSNHTNQENEFGNITESLGWIRDLPSGSMSIDDINRIYKMLGYSSENELPGNKPTRLSFILGIKNFSKDISPNDDDPDLPVNPLVSKAPTTLIALISKDRIEKVEYNSWFQRYGSIEDHRHIQFEIEEIPHVVLLYGSFELGDSDEKRDLLDDPSLSAFSRILDNTILSVVDIILDIGSVLNAIPEAIVDTSGGDGGEITLELLDNVRVSHAPEPLGRTYLNIGSGPHPIILNEDHLIISRDLDLAPIDGRMGYEEPLVGAAVSVQFTGLSSIYQSYDPNTDNRDLQILMEGGQPFRFDYLEHYNNSLETAMLQSVRLDKIPSNLSIQITPEIMNYQADVEIGNITYIAQQDEQRNAIVLKGLPSEFNLFVGQEIGFSSETPLESIAIQLANSTDALTMDGDHVLFWQDGDISEASLSVKISGLTKATWRSPNTPGAKGAEGLAKLTLERPQAIEFNAVLIDETNYLNKHLGLNATLQFEPLPANISLDVPTEATSDDLTLPDFGDEGGIQGFSNFLGGLVQFGTGMNDVIGNLTRNFLGANDGEENFTSTLDLAVDTPFDLTMEAKKGNFVDEVPEWKHGISAKFEDRTMITLNHTSINLSTSKISELEEILSDGIIKENEREEFILILEKTIEFPEKLAEYLVDGIVSEEEYTNLDKLLLREKGLILHEERSYHIRTWLPDLAPIIRISYDYEMVEDKPAWRLDINMEDWEPRYSDLEISASGLSGIDLDFRFSGFDTEKLSDIEIELYLVSDYSFVVPRVSIDMHYSLSQPLDYAYLTMLDHSSKQRIETMIKNVAKEANLAATIGDILLIDFTVPDSATIDGKSADAVMLQTTRYVDNKWWPATIFMRDLPTQMSLATEPATVFDITEDLSFQGSATLDYNSNGDDMDLYISASGRAIDSRADLLLIAENLARTTSIKPTSDWGMKLDSSGNGIGKLYYRQSDTPIQPGVRVVMMEAVGENIKSATVHSHYVANYYPIIVVQDITGGRIIVTSQADVEMMGINFDGKGVLVDTQFTGFVPSASSFGVNGISSDLSLLNSLTGGGAKTTHILFPEPISSGIATLIATLLS